MSQYTYMSEQDPSAAGRETDHATRWERIANGLEKNFEECNLVVDGLFERIRRRADEVLSEQDFLFLARYMRASAQMASVMARVESIKNRGSNTK